MRDAIPVSELAEYLRGKVPGPFRVSPYWSRVGDFLAVHFEDEPAFAVQLTPEVTLLLAFSDKRIVGVKIYDVKTLIDNTPE